LRPHVGGCGASHLHHAEQARHRLADPRPEDPVTGRVVTESPVRVYSAQELNATGNPNLCGALRQLDPGFHRGDQRWA
jgi:hypothetical protein